MLDFFYNVLRKYNKTGEAEEDHSNTSISTRHESTLPILMVPENQSMDIAEHVIELLNVSGHLDISSTVNLASTHKGSRGLLTENYWESRLQQHFPSYYLSKHFTLDIKWKNEYKTAYIAMSLRYMDGANLQLSKVVHFGPTLDADTVNGINNCDGGYYVPLERDNYHKAYSRVSYENHMFGAESDVLVTSKLAAPKVKRNFIPCGSAMKLNNMIYLTNRHFLSCYDIRYPSRCLWQHKISEGGRPIIAIDNKVFYLDCDALVCLQAGDGKVLFSISAYDEVLRRKGSKWSFNEKQLAIEGDFAVWPVQCRHLVCIVVVANWRHQKICATYDLKVGQFIKFAVVGGIMYTNMYSYWEERCVALDLDLAHETPKINQLWHFQLNSLHSWYYLAPCVYGDLVFTMFSVPRMRNSSSVVAIDARSGEQIWHVDFQIGSLSDKYQTMDVVYFYVIEGTASISDRKKLREKRIANAIKGETRSISGDVQKSQFTKFPTLRFSVQIKADRLLFEGALIAETGEVLYFKESSEIEAQHKCVAISKHERPQYLTMSP